MPASKNKAAANCPKNIHRAAFANSQDTATLVPNETPTRPPATKLQRLPQRLRRIRIPRRSWRSLKNSAIDMPGAGSNRGRIASPPSFGGSQGFCSAVICLTFVNLVEQQDFAMIIEHSEIGRSNYGRLFLNRPILQTPF